MPVLKRLKHLVDSIPGPVRSAGGLVFDTLLPGGARVVELVKETIDWATGKGAPPQATEPDYERLEGLLKILKGRLDDVAEAVNALQVSAQIPGYVRGKIINGPDMPEALRDLDDLARRFDVLEASHRQLLRHYHFAGPMLEKVLVLTRRLVGVSELTS